MSDVYKAKIMNDINEMPVNMLPKVYKIVHLLKNELRNLNPPTTQNRQSLKGIWKDCEIDDGLFDEAKKSLFNYK